MGMGWRVALAAASLACGSSAQAAFITYTIGLEGTGSRTTTSSDPFGSTVGLQSAVITLGFNADEGATSAFLTGPFDNFATIRAREQGFSVLFSPAPANYSISGSGSVCFAGGATGVLPTMTLPLAGGCTLAYSIVSSRAGLRESFSGTVTSFSVSSQATGTNSYTIASFVPEPSTWALMLAGFGLTGYALRRRRGTVGFTAAA